jgi:hypothetical protein
VGGKEAEEGTINVRVRDGEDLGETSVEAFVKGLPPFTVPQLAVSLARAQQAQAAE